MVFLYYADFLILYILLEVEQKHYFVDNGHNVYSVEVHFVFATLPIFCYLGLLALGKVLMSGYNFSS